MDFNWDSPALREEVAAIVRWWLERGIDGFRLDVINYISKRPGLPDGNRFIGDLMEFTGIEHYYYGPKLHSYLHELRQKAFEPYEAFSVGETPGIGREMGKLLTQQHRGELDLIFNFDHLETPGHVRSDDYRYDLNFLKRYYIDYSRSLTGHEWLSLFFENHDNPRMSSKVNPDPSLRGPLSKLLLSILLLLKGTPFLFQGQELGRGNQDFSSLDEFRDVESLNKYRALLAEGKSEKEALVVLLAGSRDHSRIVMAWDDSPHGGFSTAEPWIRQDALYQDVNVAAQRDDATSVWRFTQDLIRLRRRIPSFAYADIRFLEEARKDYFCWERVAGTEQGANQSADLTTGADTAAGANGSAAIANDESAAKGTAKDTATPAGTSAYTIRVEMNLSSERKALPTLKNANAQLVLCNYPHEEVPSVFEPYEVRIWQY
jgi:oligo-1,6-glucosidase